MRFEDILKDGRLWAVIYDGDSENIFVKTFNNWLDPLYLESFLTQNQKDLESYFKITNIDEAIFGTISEAKALALVILDISPDANLDRLFQPLENSRMNEMILSREKAKGLKKPSWIRLYAIKIESGVFIITGGAIKLTRTMAERQHTLNELRKMEFVRNHLISNGVFDLASMKDYIHNDDERN